MKKILRLMQRKDRSASADEQEYEDELEELAASGDYIKRTSGRGSVAPGGSGDEKSPTSDHASCLTSFERKGRTCSTYGRTELHKAARKGRSDDVRDLLANGKIRLSDTDADGLTPLHDAAISDASTAAEVMRMLCARSDLSCINRKNNDGQTALHIAAARGHLETVKVLLEYKADHDELDDNEETPLHLAAVCPDRKLGAEVISLLCIHDDKDDGRKVHKPSQASTTGSKRRQGAAGDSADGGTRRSYRTVGGGQPFSRNIVDDRNATGKTALHLVAASGNVDAVKVLLEHGARPAARDENGHTALHSAASCPDDATAKLVIEELCADEKTLQKMRKKEAEASRDDKDRQRGGHAVDADSGIIDTDEEDLVNLQGNKGRTALHLAAAGCKLATVKCLISFGASKHIADKKGRTALHYIAAKYREEAAGAGKAGDTVKEVVAALCRASSPTRSSPVVTTGKNTSRNRNSAALPPHLKVVDFIQHQDANGETALHLAAKNGQLKIVSALLEFKAPVYLTDKKGYTPIMAAAFAKDVFQVSDVLAELCAAEKTDKAHKTINVLSKNSHRSALHAAAFNGQIDAVVTLVKNGADPELQDVRENTALHTALQPHNTTNAADVVKVMCQLAANKSFVRIHGEKKKTALHLAASKGLLEVFNILVENGAKLDVLDEEQWTPLHDACLGFEDDQSRSATIVRALCELTSATDRKSFIDRQNSTGETALHIAARLGHRRAIDILIEFGARLDIKDNEGWTVLHSSVASADPLIARTIINTIKAAKQQQQQQQEPKQKPSLKAFGKMVIKSGKTAAAAAEGSQDQQKPSGGDVTKAPGSTLATSPVGVLFKDLTRHLMVTQNISKVLNDVDNWGNTALHLAADSNSADLFEELKDLNPELLNKSKMTALHIAATKSNAASLKAILTVFYGKTRSKHVDIDHKNGRNDSVLHACCREGDVEKVRLLLSYGADLERLGCSNYTILHRLVKVYVKDRKDTALREKIENVYQEIVRQTVAWKCVRDNKVLPKPDSEMYYSILRDTIRHLVCDLKYKGMNVLQYAAKKGATQLLDDILNTPYVFKNPVNEKFEITYLIPDTVPEVTSSLGNAGDGDDQPPEVFLQPGKKPLSCLELVVNNSDISKAEDVLTIYPFNHLVQKYWVICRRIYNVLLICHILQMGLFSIYVMPTPEFIARRFNLTEPPSADEYPDAAQAHEDAEHRRLKTLPLFGLFLIWPAFIVLAELLAFCEFLYRKFKDFEKSERKVPKRRGHVDQDDEPKKDACLRRVLKLMTMGKLLIKGFEYLSHVSAIAYTASMLAWYIKYLYGTNHHAYCECLAAVFIFGWMHTISYVKMFKDWHMFASIFRYIVAKDGVRFAYVFVFVLISFSFAIHSLSVSLYPPVAMHERSLAETIYLTFFLTMTVTAGALLEISTEPDYEQAGGNVHLLHLVFAAYICTSTIILLNMLIAMMNSTYSSFNQSKATAWRIESLRTALWVERKLPFIKRSMFVRFETSCHQVDDQPRWFIAYTPEQLRVASLSESVEEESDLMKSVRELEQNITQLREECRSSDGRVHEATSQTSKLFEGLRQQLTSLVEDQRAIRNQLAKQLDTMANLQVQMISMHQLYETKFSAPASTSFAAAAADRPLQPSAS